jgi:hypothetical protein
MTTVEGRTSQAHFILSTHVNDLKHFELQFREGKRFIFTCVLSLIVERINKTLTAVNNSLNIVLAKTAHLSSLLPAEDALEPLSELLQHKQTRLTEIEEYKKQAEQYEANIQKSATHIQSILASPPNNQP